MTINGISIIYIRIILCILLYIFKCIYVYAWGYKLIIVSRWNIYIPFFFFGHHNDEHKYYNYFKKKKEKEGKPWIAWNWGPCSRRLQIFGLIALASKNKELYYKLKKKQKQKQNKLPNPSFLPFTLLSFFLSFFLMPYVLLQR